MPYDASGIRPIITEAGDVEFWQPHCAKCGWTGDVFRIETEADETAYTNTTVTHYHPDPAENS